MAWCFRIPVQFLVVCYLHSGIGGSRRCGVLLAKQLSVHGCVAIEHSTVLYGESFWCKRRKSCTRPIIQEIPSSAAFLGKAMVSHRLVQKWPLQGYSSCWQHWLEPFLSVSSQFMAGSLSWVDTMWFKMSFSFQDHPTAALGGREPGPWACFYMLYWYVLAARVSGYTFEHSLAVL